MSHDFCHLHQIKRLMLSSEDFGGTIHKSNGSDLTTSTLSHSQYRPSIGGAIKVGLPRASSITEAGAPHHVTTWQTTGAGCCRYPPQPVRTRTSVDTHAHAHTHTRTLIFFAAVPSALPSRQIQLHTAIYEFKTRRFTNTHFHTNSLCPRYKGGELLARVGRVWKSAPYQHRTDSDCSDTDTSDPSCHQPPPKRLCVCDWKFSLRHASLHAHVRLKKKKKKTPMWPSIWG